MSESLTGLVWLVLQAEERLAGWLCCASWVVRKKEGEKSGSRVFQLFNEEVQYKAWGRRRNKGAVYSFFTPETRDGLIVSHDKGH